MLTENQVIDIVSDYLRNNGYKILNESTTNKKGIDIVAENPQGKKCYIEAKGGTSSKTTSRRYGKPFNKN